MTLRLGSHVNFVDMHPEDAGKSIHRIRTVTRSGIVWSPAPGPGCVWVIPDDGAERHVMVRSPPRGFLQILPKRVDTSMDIPWDMCREEAKSTQTAK